MNIPKRNGHYELKVGQNTIVIDIETGSERMSKLDKIQAGDTSRIGGNKIVTIYHAKVVDTNGNVIDALPEYYASNENKYVDFVSSFVGKENGASVNPNELLEKLEIKFQQDTGLYLMDAKFNGIVKNKIKYTFYVDDWNSKIGGICNPNEITTYFEKLGVVCKIAEKKKTIRAGQCWVAAIYLPLDFSLNESKNMRKQIIKLTESDLHRIIKKSVNRLMERIEDSYPEVYDDENYVDDSYPEVYDEYYGAEDPKYTVQKNDYNGLISMLKQYGCEVSVEDNDPEGEYPAVLTVVVPKGIDRRGIVDFIHSRGYSDRDVSDEQGWYNRSLGGYVYYFESDEDKKELERVFGGGVTESTIRRAIKEDHGLPDSTTAIIYSDIIEDYQAQEIAEEYGISEEQAAAEWFKGVADEMDFAEDDMPLYRKFVMNIPELNSKLYHDYGAGYYFLVKNSEPSQAPMTMENTIRRAIRESLKRLIETDCASVMQTGCGKAPKGTNPEAGQYPVPFGSDEDTDDRHPGFSVDGKAKWNKKGGNTSVMRRPMYNPKSGKKK